MTDRTQTEVEASIIELAQECAREAAAQGAPGVADPLPGDWDAFEEMNVLHTDETYDLFAEAYRGELAHQLGQ